MELANGDEKNKY